MEKDGVSLGYHSIVILVAKTIKINKEKEVMERHFVPRARSRRVKTTGRTYEAARR